MSRKPRPPAAIGEGRKKHFLQMELEMNRNITQLAHYAPQIITIFHDLCCFRNVKVKIWSSLERVNFLRLILSID